jgi:hypothetical protein
MIFSFPILRKDDSMQEFDATQEHCVVLETGRILALSGSLTPSQLTKEGKLS